MLAVEAGALSSGFPSSTPQGKGPCSVFSYDCVTVGHGQHLYQCKNFRSFELCCRKRREEQRLSALDDYTTEPFDRNTNATDKINYKDCDRTYF